MKGCGSKHFKISIRYHTSSPPSRRGGTIRYNDSLYHKFSTSRKNPLPPCGGRLFEPRGFFPCVQTDVWTHYTMNAPREWYNVHMAVGPCSKSNDNNRFCGYYTIIFPSVQARRTRYFPQPPRSRAWQEQLRPPALGLLQTDLLYISG